MRIIASFPVRSFANRALSVQICTVEPVSKSHCLIGLPPVERLTAGGLGGLLIGGSGSIRVSGLLKVSLRSVGLVLSVVPWLRL